MGDTDDNMSSISIEMSQSEEDALLNGNLTLLELGARKSKLLPSQTITTPADPKLSGNVQQLATNATIAGPGCSTNTTNETNQSKKSNVGQTVQPVNIDHENDSKDTANGNAPTNKKKKRESGAQKRKAKVLAAKDAELKLPTNLYLPKFAKETAPSTTPKRQREAMPKTESETRLQRNAKRISDQKTPTTTANVVQESILLVAIVDVAANGNIKPLDVHKSDLLLKHLNNRTFAALESRSFLPTFSETRNIGIAMRMRCTNKTSRDWLEATIAGMKPLWEFANLIVIDFKDLPKPNVVNAWFVGCEQPTASILAMLEAVNPGVSTHSWSVTQRLKTEKGITLKLGLDDDSLAQLESRDLKLFFGAVVAPFYIVKRGNTTYSTDAKEDTNMDIDQTDNDTDKNKDVNIPDSGSNSNIEATDEGMATSKPTSDVSVLHTTGDTTVKEVKPMGVNESKEDEN